MPSISPRCLTAGAAAALVIGALVGTFPGGDVSHAQGQAAAPLTERVDFEQAIAPVVIRRCVSCHNPGENKGGLDLTSKSAALKGGDGGEVIIAGAPGDSPLVERVREGTMPPPGKGVRLTAEEVAALARWIEQGAPWPENRTLSAFEISTEQRAGFDWWSFQPVRRPRLPEVRSRAWPQSPIDRFVLAALEERGLAPAPAAERATFLRRLSFDLIGLPPSPEDLDDYLADDSPEAEVRVVDRLLASPHYGERWGRHWLDVARFGESDGFENDKLRSEAWPYRDYVIQSLNADKPYDQFVREQLAGDVLPGATRESIAGSGFLVAGPWDEIQFVAKSPTERLRAREEQMEELVAAVGQAFLGLTLNCARCHDHKFDPIAQTDYYRIKSVFDGVDHGNRPQFTPEEQQAHDEFVNPLTARVAEIKKSIAALEAKAGVSSSDRIPAAAFVEGRFGDTFHPRLVQPGVRSQPRWHEPPFTVECWARVTNKAPFNILVANNPKESADHWELYTYAGSGEFSAYFPGFEPPEIKSGIDITDGKWRYLACTFDGRTVTLFIDGAPVKETAITRKREGGPMGSLFFGAYPPHRIGCDGFVDEVRLSNTLRRIESLPEREFAADEHTTGLWHFARSDGERVKNFAPAALPAETPSEGQTDVAPLLAEIDALRAEMTGHEARMAARPVPLVYAGTRRQPEPTVVYHRGDIRKPGETVAPGGLSLSSLSGDLGLSADAAESERRRQFARWVIDPRHPLTARVLVNRVWQHHFGQGFVETPSDFGFHGGLPSHPQLLDWLASELMGDESVPAERRWSLKTLHRQIVLSATYRQSSQFNPQGAAIDADNRLLWRYAPRRLEAEVVRDAMLAASGELNPQVGGPSFRPFTVSALLTQFYHLIDDGRPEFNRRTIYRISVNTAKSPFLDALDCPAPSLAAPRRRSTTTPLQALALMNDPFVERQAARFAARLGESGSGPVDHREAVARAYRIALGRTATPEELATATRLARDHGLPSVCWALLNASEFLYVR